MKKTTLVKVMGLATFSVLLTACASGKDHVIEAPQLGAAIAKPAAPQIVETPRGPSMTLDNVLFDLEASNLRAEAAPTIEKAAFYLNSNPDRIALIEGHTDSTGDDSYNLNLSHERSESIKDALTSMGIDSSRIQTQGFGESQPLNSNDTIDARRANRRVEIIFAED